MLLMRKFEEKCGQLYGQQKIRGFLHLYIGQEAVVAGAISVLKPEDSMITAYRDHAHAIAKGMSPNAAMAEMFGKATGCSKGKGGSMHFFDKSKNDDATKTLNKPIINLVFILFGFDER